jgi:hypothetical protein
MKTTIWGLIQSTFVSVPDSVNSFDMSKTAEGEWCAHTGAATKKRTMANKIPENLCLKEVLPLTLCAKYITR